MAPSRAAASSGSSPSVGPAIHLTGWPGLSLCRGRHTVTELVEEWTRMSTQVSRVQLDAFPPLGPTWPAPK